MKIKILSVFVTIVLAIVIFFVGIDTREAGTPLEAYQVYLNGEKIGLIQSKDELLNLIDTEQTEIKRNYHVKKVYPPSGLEIEKVYTYNNEIVSVQEIYDRIKDIEPFTIEGYKIKITYTEKKVTNEGEEKEPGPPAYIYVMDRDVVEKALYNTSTAFIGSVPLNDFENGTQAEITETGEIITSVYFEETITIKKELISVKEKIFTDVDELSQYLLYGTLDKQAEYTVKDGEDLETIAEKNKLSVEELLIANPQYVDSSVLLTAGEVLNIGFINPLVSVVYRKTVVDDISMPYKTETVKDNTKYEDYKVTTTNGQNGIMRVTQEIKYINGVIQKLDFSKREVIKESINEVVQVGTKKLGGWTGYYQNTQGNDTWSWPTISPFIITSPYGYRSGEFHKGVDISGCGYGSPIYAVKEGVVVETGSHYSMGNYIYIDHQNGYVTQYMHLSKILVSKGQTVSKEQKIGLMGSSGISTGTHLHIGVWQGYPYEGGTVLNPCKSIFTC